MVYFLGLGLCERETQQNNTSAGADAPHSGTAIEKWEYFDHPYAPWASTEIIGRPNGNTWKNHDSKTKESLEKHYDQTCRRYSWDCLSKNSRDGADTTDVGIFPLLSKVAASRASETSVPVAINTSFGETSAESNEKYWTGVNNQFYYDRGGRSYMLLV